MKKGPRMLASLAPLLLDGEKFCDIMGANLGRISTPESKSDQNCNNNEGTITSFYLLVALPTCTIATSWRA